MNWGIPIGQRRERTFHLKRKSGFQYQIECVWVLKITSDYHHQHRQRWEKSLLSKITLTGSERDSLVICEWVWFIGSFGGKASSTQASLDQTQWHNSDTLKNPYMTYSYYHHFETHHFLVDLYTRAWTRKEGPQSQRLDNTRIICAPHLPWASKTARSTATILILQLSNESDPCTRSEYKSYFFGPSPRPALVIKLYLRARACAMNGHI